MRPAPSPLRSTVGCLASALALLGLPASAPASAATWQLEPIVGSTDVAGLHTLAFDMQGRAVLSWNGAQRNPAGAPFGGLASRDPAGGWQRSPDLAGVEPADAQIHLFALTRALLVGRETTTTTSRRRLVVAEGQSDGGFGPFTVLDEFVGGHWSDANETGDAILAWSVERSPFIRIAERAAGEGFGAARDLAVGKTAAVSINARGDRVVAWRAGKRLAARIRPAGGEWSPAVRFGSVRAIQGLRLSALMARNGRVVVTWGREGRACGVSVRGGDGTWRTRTLERRCGPTGAGTRAAPVLALADSRGATYVVWTGRTRSGRRVVKFGRVGEGASRTPLLLSRERGAVLDDAAAGPSRTLAITYTAPQPTPASPLTIATFAALRRGGGSFGHAERLTPPTVLAARGSRVAFHPLTGEPVVAVPYLVGQTIAVGAAVRPPVPAP